MPWSARSESFDSTLALKIDFPIPGPARSMYIIPDDDDEGAAGAAAGGEATVTRGAVDAAMLAEIHLSMSLYSHWRVPRV